jgi:flagellar export protein FliJ
LAAPAEYPLQALLGIRERAKEAAEHKLADALDALKAEQERLRQLEEELARMVARREAKAREYAEKAMRGEMSAQQAIDANVYIERLKRQEEEQKNAIAAQKAVVRQREEDVDNARKELVDATQELKAIEKNKEKWMEQIKKEAEAKQDEAMDEVAQTIFLSHDH